MQRRVKSTEVEVAAVAAVAAGIGVAAAVAAAEGCKWRQGEAEDGMCSLCLHCAWPPAGCNALQRAKQALALDVRINRVAPWGAPPQHLDHSAVGICRIFVRQPRLAALRADSNVCTARGHARKGDDRPGAT